MPTISRNGFGNVPGWNGFYCEFRNNPVAGKRAAAAATGTENDRNLLHFSGHGNVPGVTFEHNPIATQTILVPVVAAGGLDLGSQDQTDNDGMQLHMGGEAMGLGVTQFVVGEAAYYAMFLDIVIADVSGTDDFAFGFREVEAVAAAIDDYTDLACLNVISGAIKAETILANAATTTTDLSVSWADAAKKSLMLKVDTAGAVTYFYSTDAAFDANGVRAAQTWTAFSAAVAYSFTDALNIMPFMYALQATDIMGVCTIRAIECGVQ
jgi:hypothetical protein